MSPASFQNLHLTEQHNGLSFGQALKRLLPEQSWSQVRKLIQARRVQVNGNLCLDEGRRVKAGDVLKVWDHSLAKPADAAEVKIVYLDEHLVVVQKPAGVTTLRHREESDLPQRRKQLQPTLDELLPRALAKHLGIRIPDEGYRPPRTSSKRKRGVPHRAGQSAAAGRGYARQLQIRAVHRLDRDTSGLMVFARSPEAEQKLIRMFARHDVQRAYVAIVHGQLTEPRTIDTRLIRNRGDGLRGSSPLGEATAGTLHAITHIRPMEQLAGYTVVECRLETGRTHQIRIHLAEIGHMLCGEKTYTHAVGEKPRADSSGAPRHALHAAELTFTHPITNQPLRFLMPLPRELREWLLKLRG